jgi:hypothetical protein
VPRALSYGLGIKRKVVIASMRLRLLNLRIPPEYRQGYLDALEDVLNTMGKEKRKVERIWPPETAGETNGMTRAQLRRMARRHA